MSYTEIEKVMNRLMAKVGSDAFLNRLIRMEKQFDFNFEEVYDKIKKAVLNYFDIDEKTLKSYQTFSDIEVNARRIFLYFITVETNMEPDEIREILKMSHKTYKRYIERVTDVLKEPSMDMELHKALKEIEIKILKH
jgi:hypothetical protein